MGALRFGLDLAQRSVATGLLCLLATLGLDPIVVSGPQSNLPACCRSNGKHHCSMTPMGGSATEGTAFNATAPKCPFCPKSGPAAQGFHFYLTVAGNSLRSPVQQPAFHWKSETPVRLSPV